jgi:hypothetical protein
MSTMVISLVLHFSFAGNYVPVISPSTSFVQEKFINPENSIQSNPTCTLVIIPDGFHNAEPNCPHASNGLILFDVDHIINGTPPYAYDWDDMGTMHNDIYSDEDFFALDSLSAGTYVLIVTDAEGCTASASTTIEDPILYATTLIDFVGLCTFTGGIQVTSFIGPPVLLNYNWDFASTPFDDDFGNGEYYMGFPPASNDQEDLLEGLEGGTYFLELTVVYDSLFQEFNCVWRDTFNIYIDSLRIVCPYGDAYIYAGVANTATTYQWQIDSLNGFEDVYPDAHHSGTSEPLLYLSDLVSSWYGHQYRCRLINGMDTTYSDPFTLRFGLCSDEFSGVWELPSSWHGNVVPDINTDVFITDLSGIIHVFNNAFCRSLTLLPESRLRIIPPGMLTIAEEP